MCSIWSISQYFWYAEIADILITVWNFWSSCKVFNKYFVHRHAWHHVDNLYPQTHKTVRGYVIILRLENHWLVDTLSWEVKRVSVFGVFNKIRKFVPLFLSSCMYKLWFLILKIRISESITKSWTQTFSRYLLTIENKNLGVQDIVSNVTNKQPCHGYRKFHRTGMFL